MKLIKVTKLGNIHYLLNDGRKGVVYPDTGYVRVATKHSNRVLYQINKIVKLITPPDYKYCRVPIVLVREQIEFLQNFEDKNCSGSVNNINAIHN
jgi:hypothetical protein